MKKILKWLAIPLAIVLVTAVLTLFDLADKGPDSMKITLSNPRVLMNGAELMRMDGLSMALFNHVTEGDAPEALLRFLLMGEDEIALDISCASAEEGATVHFEGLSRDVYYPAESSDAHPLDTFYIPEFFTSFDSARYLTNESEEEVDGIRCTRRDYRIEGEAFDALLFDAMEAFLAVQEANDFEVMLFDLEEFQAKYEEAGVSGIISASVWTGEKGGKCDLSMTLTEEGSDDITLRLTADYAVEDDVLTALSGNFSFGAEGSNDSIDFSFADLEDALVLEIAYESGSGAWSRIGFEVDYAGRTAELLIASDELNAAGSAAWDEAGWSGELWIDDSYSGEATLSAAYRDGAVKIIAEADGIAYGIAADVAAEDVYCADWEPEMNGTTIRYETATEEELAEFERELEALIENAMGILGEHVPLFGMMY